MIKERFLSYRILSFVIRVKSNEHLIHHQNVRL